jgi:hypothetical protein
VDLSLPALFDEYSLLALSLNNEINITSHFSSAVEQLIRNQQVEGSNPLSGSLIINELRGLFRVTLFLRVHTFSHMAPDNVLRPQKSIHVFTRF